MFEKILCAIDGSEHSDRAIEIASDLAGRYGAELHLIHVLLDDVSSEQLRRYQRVEGHPRQRAAAPEDRRGEAAIEGPLAAPAIAGAVPEPVPRNEATPQQVAAEIGEMVVDAARFAAEAKGVAVADARIEQGDPAKCIVEAAGEVPVDAIVMGSRGLSDLKGLWLGSVSHKVSSTAGCHCITVK